MFRIRLVALIVVALSVAVTHPSVRAEDDTPVAAFARAVSNTALVLATDAQVSGDWAVASATTDEPGEPALLIARRESGGWRALSPQTGQVDVYNAWLGALPPTLVSAEDQTALTLATPAEVRAAQALPPFDGYRLPYAESWSAFMSQGPVGQFSHAGYWAIDLVLPTSTGYTATVIAAKSGVVMYVKDVSDIGGLRSGLSGYANGVVIRHGPGEYSWYWHLAHRSVPADVQPGLPIEAGTVLGWMGSTGYSSGPHLHFQVSEAFAWAGCSAITGCSARETRIDRAPFSKTLRGADFDEVTDEARWDGCSSRAACAMNAISANVLSAADGVVLYWSPQFHGPGWKVGGSALATVPRWLQARAGSLGVPEGWWVQVTGTAGNSVFESGQTILPTTLKPAALTVAPLITVTKYVRNDLPVAWPYQFGSADERVARVSDAAGSAVKPCAWRTVLVPPGKHALQAAVQARGANSVEFELTRWPPASVACVDPPVDPGPLPAATPCLTPTIDALEPNDDLSSATPLSFTEAQRHVTIVPGDADWAVITVPHGMRFTVSTTDLEADADPVLQLFARDGDAELARNDDAVGYGARVAWVASGAGAYRVRATQWDPGISGCNTGFTLRAEHTAAGVVA